MKATSQKTSREKVSDLPGTARVDAAIASAMENAYDAGLREDAEDDGEGFWAEVLGQVHNELDAELEA